MQHIKKWIKVFTLLLLSTLLFSSTAQAAATLEITKRLTWDVMGLDSNDELNSGPDTFAVGYRACNTGSTTATNVVGTYIWDTDNIYINLSPGTSSTIAAGDLVAGECYDFYWNVIITRDDAARTTDRDYHITISADNATSVSTPMSVEGGTRNEIYVENLISQNRNSVTSLTGDATVVKGNIYTFTLDAQTATNGYEQIEAFVNFPNNIFRIISATTDYSVGGTGDSIYSDACNWVHNPDDPNYFEFSTNTACQGTDKAGGTLHIVYEIEIIGTGTSGLSTLIYDFSGSSFHYNSDFGGNVLSVTAIDPSELGVQIIKTADVSVLPTASGQEATFTLTVNTYELAQLDTVDVTDTLPTGWTYASDSVTLTDVNGTTTMGGNPDTVSGQILTWNLGAMDFNQTITITYKATTNIDFNDGDRTTNIAEVNATSGGTPYSFSNGHTIKFVAVSATKYSTPDNLLSLPGDTINYTIELNNTATIGSESSLNNISIVDTLPVGVIYDVLSATVTQYVDDGNETFIDNFNTNGSYAGSDGSLSWATDWVEEGQTSDATTDEIYVSGNELVFTKQAQATGIYREVDLSAYTSGVTLSLEYRRELVDAAESITLQISNDGGLTWVTLDTYIGDGGTDSSNIHVEYNIQEYASSNTQIQFLFDDAGTSEYFYVDNVQITAYKRKVETAPLVGDDITNIALAGPMLAGETLTVDFTVTVDANVVDLNITELNNTASITSNEITDPIVVTTSDAVATPPVAEDDYSANNIAGTAVSLDLLVNDTLENGSAATVGTTTIDLDPITAGIQTTFVVADEGTWTLDTGTGIVTFTPDVGFIDDPSLINYELIENTTGLTDIARIIIDYTKVVPEGCYASTWGTAPWTWTTGVDSDTIIIGSDLNLEINVTTLASGDLDAYGGTQIDSIYLGGLDDLSVFFDPAAGEGTSLVTITLTFDKPVFNASFSITDIDTDGLGNREDKITVTSDVGTPTLEAVTTASTTFTISANSATAISPLKSLNDDTGTVSVTIPDGATTITISYEENSGILDPTGRGIGILGDLGVCAGGSVTGNVQDTAGIGLNAVTITLKETNGTVVAFTTTDVNGDYSFINVAPGEYTVEETNPSGYSSVSDIDSSDDNDTTVNVNTNDDSIPVTVVASEVDADNNFVDILPDLSVTKTIIGVGPFRQGDTVSYTIEINCTNASESNITVNDTPTGLSAMTITASSGSNEDETDCGKEGQTTFPCTINDMDAGETVTLTVEGVVQ